LIQFASGFAALGSALESASQPLPFSAEPSAEEILRSHVFEEPLVPVGGEPGPAENAALAGALAYYSKRRGPDDFSSLTVFLDQHPNSPWTAALLTDLGLEYYNTAHYSLALDAWEKAWARAKDATDLKAKGVGDRAAGELACMYARLGRMTELEALLKSVEGRVFVGPATEKITGAREGLWHMQNRPEMSFRCGPLALQRVKLAVDPRPPTVEVLRNAASTQKGTSLAQVAEWSDQMGLNYQMAFRQKGAEFAVPSVVHWKVGHYAAIVRHEGDRFLVQDPTFRNDVWATEQALEAEASGYFLIPAGPLRKGWRTVGAKEGQTVWGKGSPNENDPDNNDPCAPQSDGSDSCSSACLGGWGGGGGGGGGPSPPFPNPFPSPTPGRGMAVSSIHLEMASLSLRDEPVGYSPPVGAPVAFWVRYSQREAHQPTTFTYANFGPKWTCDWISYITDNPQSLSANVTYYIRGGGTRTFTGFNSNAQNYASQTFDQTHLSRTGSANYQMLWPDGSKTVFGQSDGSIGTSRKIFLTQIVDPFGNAVTLNYDSFLRLTNITDALGQSTTLSYGLTNDIYKITQVTDPFNRSAYFYYDNLGRLTNITDVIGLTSQFTYQTNGDFVNSLVTPYGTTTFSNKDNGTVRGVETTFPDGSRERVENSDTVPNMPDSDPQASVPQGMFTANSGLSVRNTYYWSRNACALGYGDYTKARIYHWVPFVMDNFAASGVLETIKEPLEGRVWFETPGQAPYDAVGSSSRPIHIGRVLDDGSTQLYTYAYDDFGQVTNAVDPVGRTFSYIYDTNGIDLLEVRMTRAGKNELLSRRTYNAQHLPLAAVDAAGQTNTYTYNARGQLLTKTNPKNETTAYFYNTDGYLVSVDGPLPGTNDTVIATYDNFGRTRTVTDVSGYTVTCDYDALDHLTKVTHPDGTYEQILYNRLDPVVLQDRAGRQTLLEFTPMRQLAKRTDPLQRVTHFQWCSCGDIKALIDPIGRTTTWQKDVQNRLLSKQYGDGSKVTYTYENTTSRLRLITDEKLQTTIYTYNPDNTVSSIAYGNSAVPTPGVSFTYDPDYTRQTSMIDGNGTTIYAYNPITVLPTLGAGHLASEDGPLPNDTVTYGYDELGRRVSTAINGLATTVTFDEAGRAKTETNSLGFFGWTYDGTSSRILSETFPNGQTVTRGYGNLVQDFLPERITHAIGATPVSEFLYDRDPLRDRISTWSQQAGNQAPNVYTFGYDDANQLLSVAVTNSGLLISSFAYSYDPDGNRLTEQTAGVTNTCTYNALNELSTTSGAGSARTNEWDGLNRLAAVNTGNQRTEFTYDGLSRLRSIRLLTNGTEASLRLFLWVGNRIAEERAASGVITKCFFAQGMKQEAGASPGSYFYTRDHLGSIREVTDASGSLRARYAYDPFGRRTRLSGDVDADFGFAGMLWAKEAGLALTRNRGYDPDAGRWLSRDPLRNAEVAEGVNLYAYVRNNPVGLVDPAGLCCEREAEIMRQAVGNLQYTIEHCSNPHRTIIHEGQSYTYDQTERCRAAIAASGDALANAAAEYFFCLAKGCYNPGKGRYCRIVCEGEMDMEAMEPLPGIEIELSENHWGAQLRMTGPMKCHAEGDPYYIPGQPFN
jgi:RHS repeat-associated protein